MMELVDRRVFPPPFNVLIKEAKPDSLQQSSYNPCERSPPRPNRHSSTQLYITRDFTANCDWSVSYLVVKLISQSARLTPLRRVLKLDIKLGNSSTENNRLPSLPANMWRSLGFNANHPDSPASSCTQVYALAPTIKLRGVKMKAVCNIGDLHLKAQRQASRHIRAKQHPS